MNKSLEPEVTERTLKWLRAEFRGELRFKSGEITVGGGNWRADIVGYDKVMGIDRQAIAVECKGKTDIVKGAGQALSYLYSGVPSMFAGYCISDSELEFIEELPLYCLNVKQNSVKLESKPDNASLANLVQEELMEARAAKTKAEQLLKLCQDITQLHGYDVTTVEPEDILRHLINQAGDNDRYNYTKPREFL